MRILELTNYTAGGCGVGMRALMESKLLASKGHNVKIFSSNQVKGTNNTCKSNEIVEGVEIKRFPAMNLGGESYMSWNFKKEAINFKPDVIIVHAYRHTHNNKALHLANELKCKVFLVTHAPFGREKTRSWFENIVVKLYDSLIGKNILKKFDKIISITQWEEKYLVELGVSKKKIVRIPNGIEEIFFRKINPIKSKPSKIVYMGRISRIKQLEVVSKALFLESPDKFNYTFNIIGPADPEYLKELDNLVKEKGLQKIEFINAKKYNKEEQILTLDNSDIFILPSKSEGMPQTLIEAMARGKIVIGSDNLGNKELITDGKNGFLFKNGDSKSLFNLLKKIRNLNLKDLNKISRNARKTAENFHWDRIIGKLERTIFSE